MSHEWPVPIQPSAAADAEPLLPLTLAEHVELAATSPALRAFAEKRAEQMVRFGHGYEKDLQGGLGDLVRLAHYKLSCFLDYAPAGVMTPPPERFDQLLRYIDVAGALLIAARERYHATPEQIAEAAFNAPDYLAQIREAVAREQSTEAPE